MRIALLHYTCPPIVGGVERIVADQARLLAQQGHEVMVICGAGEEEATRGEYAGKNWHFVLLPELRADTHAEHSAREPWWEGERLVELLRQQTVVLLHNVLTMPFHLRLTRQLWRWVDQLSQVRFVAWIHDLAAGNSEYREVLAAAGSSMELLRKAHTRIEYVAVSTVRREQFLQQTGAAKCRVIPNGIDPLEHLRLPPLVERLAREWSLLERPLVLLHPARLLRRKNVEASVALVAALRAHMPGCVLLLTGAPDPHQAASQVYAQELRQRIEAQGLEQHICWASAFGEVGNAELAALYTVADALFFPSWQEGFGLPVLEAALHRLPIFCSAIEPLQSLLPQSGVTVFPPEIPAAEIACEIMRQAEGSKAIHNRKAVVREYGWPAIYEKFLAPLLASLETEHLP